MALGVISQTEQKFRADPAAAKSNPSVTATLANGRARLSAGAFNWEADLGPALGGQNLAPSPTAYLLGSLAGCAVAFLNDTLAPQFGVTVTDVRATARCSSDARGLIGQDGVAPDLMDIGLEIVVASPDPDDRVASMLRAWEQRCPIYLALLKPNAIAFTASVAAV
jgi:uncharacterized OsmC-like protein